MRKTENSQIEILSFQVVNGAKEVCGHYYYGGSPPSPKLEYQVNSRHPLSVEIVIGIPEGMKILSAEVILRSDSGPFLTKALEVQSTQGEEKTKLYAGTVDSEFLKEHHAFCLLFKTHTSTEETHSFLTQKFRINHSTRINTKPGIDTIKLSSLIKNAPLIGKAYAEKLNDNTIFTVQDFLEACDLHGILRIFQLIRIERAPLSEKDLLALYELLKKCVAGEFKRSELPLPTPLIEHSLTHQDPLPKSLPENSAQPIGFEILIGKVPLSSHYFPNEVSPKFTMPKDSKFTLQFTLPAKRKPNVEVEIWSTNGKLIEKKNLSPTPRYNKKELLHYNCLCSLRHRRLITPDTIFFVIKIGEPPFLTTYKTDDIRLVCRASYQKLKPLDTIEIDSPVSKIPGIGLDLTLRLCEAGIDTVMKFIQEIDRTSPQEFSERFTQPRGILTEKKVTEIYDLLKTCLPKNFLTDNIHLYPISPEFSDLFLQETVNGNRKRKDSPAEENTHPLKKPRSLTPSLQDDRSFSEHSDNMSGNDSNIEEEDDFFRRGCPPRNSEDPNCSSEPEDPFEEGQSHNEWPAYSSPLKFYSADWYALFHRGIPEEKPQPEYSLLMA